MHQVRDCLNTLEVFPVCYQIVVQVKDFKAIHKLKALIIREPLYLVLREVKLLKELKLSHVKLHVR
jgi:hypothetical protein